MNTLNLFGAKPIIQFDNRIIRSLNCNRQILSKSFPSLRFRTSLLPSFSPIKAAFSSSSPLFTSQNPNAPINPNNKPLTLSWFSILFSFLKPKIIAIITATSLFFTRFYYNPKPATTISPSKTENTLLYNSKNIRATRKLMKIQIKNKKFIDALSTIDKLIDLQPHKTRWHLLKSLLCVYTKAKLWSDEILKKDPLLEKSYHDLLMAASREDSVEKLKKIKKKIEEDIVNASIKKKVEMSFKEIDRLDNCRSGHGHTEEDFIFLSLVLYSLCIYIGVLSIRTAHRSGRIGSLVISSVFYIVLTLLLIFLFLNFLKVIISHLRKGESDFDGRQDAKNEVEIAYDEEVHGCPGMKV